MQRSYLNWMKTKAAKKNYINKRMKAQYFRKQVKTSIS